MSLHLSMEKSLYFATFPLLRPRFAPSIAQARSWMRVNGPARAGTRRKSLATGWRYGDTVTPVLNAKQAAEFLGVTPIWVRKLAAAGRIKAEKIGGRDWIFKPADLAQFAKIPRDVGPPTKAERRKYLRLKAARKS